ncbi:dynein axonemal assembly factor 8-like [Discoglossus pictus]
MTSNKEGLQDSSRPHPKWSGVSGWESVFSKVQAQVPSLDSDDASLSDCDDEELNIFQRDVISYIQDLSEEEEKEDPKIQDESVPTTSGRSAWLEPESSTEPQVEPSPHIIDAEQDANLFTEPPSPSLEQPPEGGFSQENGDRQLHGLETVDHDSGDCKPRVENGRTIDEHNFFPTEPTTVTLQSLKYLEQWDLDAVLQQLKDVGDRSVSNETTSDPDKSSAEKTPPLLLPLENMSVKRQDRIMEQLAQMSAKQYQARSEVQQLMMETPNRGAKNNSFSLLGLKNSQNSPTVYIDLRIAPPDPSIPSGGVLDEQIPAQREAEKEEEISQTDTPSTPRSERTGKSLLLHQLRETKRVPPEDPPDITPPQSPPAPEGKKSPREATPAHIRRKRRVKNKVDANRITTKIEEEPEEEDKGREEQKTQLEEGVPQSLQPLLKKSEQKFSMEEVIVRERQEKEKKNRLRMQAHLEELKPRNSVSGRQAMAESTPVLFHPETSYSCDISTLPVTTTSGIEMLLLTVWLSSCGQITIPGQHSSRSSDISLSLANTYHTLVVWLLSLVPALNPQFKGDAPFQVLGLQQAWREDGLALYACITPRHLPAKSSPKSRKHKGMEGQRGTSSFYQQISQFLSHNTLQSVAWWSEEVTQRLQGQVFVLPLKVPDVRLSNIATANPAPEAVEKAFSSSCGFFWQTLETEEKLSPLGLEISTDSDTEVVSVLLFDTLLKDPASFHHTLHLILTAGLDVCGLRLLYPQDASLHSYIDSLPSSYTVRDVGDAQSPAVLALALRGPRAGEVWTDISGPSDPQLARRTDQHSLYAVYGSSRGEPLLNTARSSVRLLRDLSLWFGGRVPDNGTMNVGIQNPPGRRSESPTEKDLTALQEIDLCRPPAMLTATSRGDVFLVVSPAVPPAAYGDIIHCCCQRGFVMQGAQNLRLTVKRTAVLSMSPTQVPIFCPSKPSAHPDTNQWPRLHCLLLLFRKENASHHTPALIHGLMNDLAEHGFLGAIRAHLPIDGELDPTMCFHVAPYSDSLLQGLGGSLHAVPDSSTLTLDMLSVRPFSCEPEIEQVVILTISGRHALRKAGSFLRQIVCPSKQMQELISEYGRQGFEILGLKWLPFLSRLQAKEITPYEVGDQPWQGSLEQLTSSPALLCALRRAHAFTALAQIIRELVPATGKGQHQLIMSATSEIAFRQACLIFTDRDLVSDPESRVGLQYIAPPGITCKSGGSEDRRGRTDSIFMYMLSGPPLLYTVLLFKPGAWSRTLGKILRKADLQKLQLVAMKLVTLSPQDALQILPEDVRQNDSLCRAHSDYLTSAPCLVLCLQRHNAVCKLLDLLGPEDPELCREQDQFLWRAQYGTNTVKNALYGSTSYQAAIQDIKRFFPEGLVCAQSPVLETEQISTMTGDILFGSNAQRQAVKNQLCQQGSVPTLDLPFTSALCQTTCLLFPPKSLIGSPPLYIQGLEQLIGTEFRLTGARLTVFNQSQAQIVADLYNPDDCLTAKFKFLTEGPCLLIAAQRDNAVTCFSSLMESVSWQKPPKQDVMRGVLCPQTESKACKMLSCFFDSLTPESIHQIVPQAS